MLPHLKYLAGLSYGEHDGDHIYLVDFEPRVFDAQIFNDVTTAVSGGVDGQASVEHPYGWGTILVGAMRFGAGPVQVDVDTTSPGSDQRNLRSAFFIMDITDPEQPPQVLIEYTSGSQGFTLSTPTPIIKNAGSEWYLLLASGPHVSADPPEGVRQAVSTQRAKIALLDLKSMSLKTEFGSSGILELPDDYSFITGMLPVDYNLDIDTDAVYFSTISGSSPSGSAPFGGKLYRLTIKDSSGYKAVTDWSAVTLLDVNDPITAIPNATVDTLGNRWIYVGTGRFLVSSDALDTDVQAIYGVKEPRSSGVFTWGAADISDMVNVTGIKVYNGGALSVASLAIPGSAPAATKYGELEAGMTLYEDNDGWYRQFQAARERNVGMAAVLGGTLSFTTFEPSEDVCNFEGTSNLYALNYTTGTASKTAVMGFDTGDVKNGEEEIEIMQNLGVGLVTTVSMHTGKGYKNKKSSEAITQGSTAVTQLTSQENKTAVNSGEVGWRVEH